MDDEAQRERDRCVSICRRRAELWRTTAATNAAPGLQQESEPRAKEAAYLADLLESGVDLTKLSPGADA
jgi:hypothetical protein